MTNNTPPASSASESRTKVLAAIKGPIGLLALVALITEGVLGAVVFRLQGEQQFYIALSMIVVLIGILGIVALFVWRGGQLDAGTATEGAGNRVSITNEVFVAAVMAGHATPEAYAKERTEVLRVVAALRNKTKGGVFYAGETLQEPSDFEQAGTVATEDMRLVAQSRYFLMIYPSKVASSVLMEAGVALAYERPSVYCISKTDDLPYLMQRAVMDKRVKATAITIQTIDQLVKMIEQKGLDLFKT